MPDPVGLLRAYKPEGKALDAGGARRRDGQQRLPRRRAPKPAKKDDDKAKDRRAGRSARTPSQDEVAEDAAKERAKAAGEGRKAEGREGRGGPAPAKPHKASGRINAIVVADTDLLNDQFWVEVREFLGQQVAIPNASNAAFVVNALDNLSGSDALIALRGRGAEDRPFKLVNELRRDAERRYREKEQALTAKLKEVQDQLAKLEKTGEGGAVLILSESDRQAIEKFRGDMLATRRELREVKRALREDIDRLDGWLKFANIALVPLLIGVGGLGWAAVRRRRDASLRRQARCAGVRRERRHEAHLVCGARRRHRAGAGGRHCHLRRPEPLVAGQGLGREPRSQPRRPGDPDRQDRAQAGRQGLDAGARQGGLVARRPRRLSGQGRGGARAAGQARPGRAGREQDAATRSATPSSSWRTPRPRTPSRASCGCSTTRAPRSPRPSSARSASMRSAPARAAPTCASRATRRPGSAMPTSTCRWPCATGCSRACSTCAAAKIAKVTIEIPGEEPLVIARDAERCQQARARRHPRGQEAERGRRHRRHRARGRRRSSWRTCASLRPRAARRAARRASPRSRPTAGSP